MLQSYNFNIKLFFIFNQTFNIFYSKILYVSFLAFDLSYYQAPYCYHLFLSCINLNTISHILVLAFYRKKVLRVLQS